MLIDGNIRIIIQLVLDVEADSRTPENDVGHHQNVTAL
jgi:hypothetical protein